MKFNHTIVKLCASTLLLLFSFLNISAQEELEYINEKKGLTINYQIRGGLNLSNMMLLYEDENANSGTKVGFNVGAFADIILSDKIDYSLHLVSGLLYTAKGMDEDDLLVSDEYGNSDYYNMDARASYLQIPVYFGFKAPFPNNRNNKLGVFLGPYFAYGISGKTSLSKGSWRSNEVDTFDKDFLWNRAELGLGMEVTLELSQLVFALGIDAGLTNGWKSSALNHGYSVKTRNTYLSVGYSF